MHLKIQRSLFSGPSGIHQDRYRFRLQYTLLPGPSGSHQDRNRVRLQYTLLPGPSGSHQDLMAFDCNTLYCLVLVVTTKTSSLPTT